MDATGASPQAVPQPQVRRGLGAVPRASEAVSHLPLPWIVLYCHCHRRYRNLREMLECHKRNHEEAKA